MRLVDVRGRRCPMLLADLSREMRQAAAGHVIEVLADSQSVVDAVVGWCHETRHTLLSIDTIEGDLRVCVGKGALPTRRPHERGAPTQRNPILTPH